MFVSRLVGYTFGKFCVRHGHEMSVNQVSFSDIDCPTSVGEFPSGPSPSNLLTDLVSEETKSTLVRPKANLTVPGRHGGAGRTKAG